MFGHTYNYRLKQDPARVEADELQNLARANYLVNAPQHDAPAPWSDSLYLRPSRWTGVAMTDGVDFESAGRGLTTRIDMRSTDRDATLAPRFASTTHPHWRADASYLWTTDVRAIDPAWQSMEMPAAAPAPLVDNRLDPITERHALSTRRAFLDSANPATTLDRRR